jgi:hypothetical protein
MDRALHKLYADRKELRKLEPAFLRGVHVPPLELGQLSKTSFDSLRAQRSDTCRLPKIAKVDSSMRGSQSHRCVESNIMVVSALVPLYWPLPLLMQYDCG